VDKKIIAMIPARTGSKRLKLKNLALINGKPLIYYAIQAAKQTELFYKIVVNSEGQIFSEIASRYGAEFYKRPLELGSSYTKSDDVVADFMNANSDADIMVWVNTIAPFLESKEIIDIINYFLDNQLDSLITVENKQVHCMWSGKPVNYNSDEQFALTQKLEPVQPFVYSIMMWRTTCFLEEYNKNGHAFFCGKFDVYPVSKMSSIIIKTEDDLKMADMIMYLKENKYNDYKVKYDPLVSNEKILK